MNLNLSKFKKISDDKNSTTLKHPGGHHIRISKSALSADAKRQLEELPMHLEEGGMAPYRSLGAQDEATKVAENAPPAEFPEAKTREQFSQEQKQPTIIINNGPQPTPEPIQAAPQPAQPQAPQVASAPMSGGYNFDFDKYSLNAQEAPLQSKIMVLEKQKAQETQQAEGAQRAAQEKMRQVLQYNKLAAERGLPQLPVPGGMAPQALPASLERPQVPQMNLAEPTPQAPQDPYGTQAYLDTYSKGVGEQESGLREEAQALGQQGKDKANILNQTIQSEQAQLKTAQDHWNELDKERQNFQADYRNGHVDPNKFLNSMGTGQKIMTAIGLILGGMGGGLTHTSNPAEDFLKKQIDNDIKAQETELGKSNNLLTANFRQFGNLKDATEMTRVMTTDIVNNKIAEAAANSQDPLAQSRAKQAIGKLHADAAPILSQLAMRRSLMGGLQASSADPSTMIRMIVPQGEQQAAYKELSEAQEQLKARDAALGAFDQLMKINTIGNRVTSPVQTPKQVAALRDNLAVQLARAAAGRVNPYEFDAAKKLFPAPGDNEKTSAIKRQQLLNFIQEKMNHPILNAYGIKIGSVGQNASRFGEGGQKKIQLGPIQPAKSEASK